MDIVLKIDNFEGPLDLLLHLIEKKKLKISEIKISQIIDEYLGVLKEAQEENLHIKVEFLVTASELLEIKASTLLSINDEENKEKELKRRLEDYKVFKEIALKIGEMEKEYNISYTRGESRKIIKKAPKEYDISKLQASDLYSAYKRYVDKKENEYLELELEKKYTLKDEMDKLYLKLYSHNRTFDSIFGEAENRMHLVYIFLAILELYKEGLILIEGEMVKRN
ncbi:MAG: ScpA family protein [Fusobacterium mortiferum]|jgi:segregation and condensation protein A|uniref:Segregation and condensation protein A n=2 Tax=Fusobacterium mortiferum TaxID=850 RepID=A0A414Q2H0_FUSMR|nr:MULTISPECIES: ScpA family protein [Fusobacterium]AVQ19023.1 segregation/condensation protein A [Fusobacterium mortiferum ATCC 9817]EEO35274.1 ScpA/B protein [Fusobacterium mortiferum ATCC 9817]MCF2626755.1 segregation/condensation protein A [Fusobacterium mortiferum]MCF2698160.1 segregation/condensation protein A [Fusobacterium mortiferum]MCI7666128.1 segregation/condensation protein A [Fusobacterium mortiferum]